MEVLRKFRVFSFILIAVIAGLLLLLPKYSTADQQVVLYGVNALDEGLSIIDPVTGDVQFIGPLSPDPNIYVTPVAMAVHPSDGTIFVWDNGSSQTPNGVLLTVDPCTGLATPVNSSTPPQGEMGALAFHPTNGKLYGLGRLPVPYSFAFGLFEIDTETGEKNRVGDSYFIVTAGADFDDNGNLFCVELDLDPNETLRMVTIDTSDGSVINTVYLSPGIGVVGSIVFTEDGTLIGSAMDHPASLGDVLFDIDPVTGEVSNVRPIFADRAPQGMGFAPVCTPLAPDQVNEMDEDYNILNRWCWVGPEQYSLYQSFTPVASPLEAIEIKLVKGEDLPEIGFSTTVQIRSGSVNGEVLGISTALVMPEPNSEMVHFDFSPPIPVFPGNTYVIEWITPNTEKFLYWVSNRYDSYAGGKAYGCLKYPMDPEEDFVFTTYSIINTSAGDDVVVQPIDVMTGQTPVTITFNYVHEVGTTTLASSPEGEPLPYGFKLGEPPVYGQITTTADYDGPVTICIDYSGITFGGESSLVLYHYEDTDGDGIADDWVGLPTEVFPEETRLCAVAGSLSFFMIVEKPTLEDLIQLVQTSNIHNGIRKSLVKKLQNALKSLEKGKTKTAINQIRAFQNEVFAQRGKKIPAGLADYWIESTEVIIQNL